MKSILYLFSLIFLVGCTNDTFKIKDLHTINNEKMSFSTSRYIGRIVTKDSIRVFQVLSVFSNGQKRNDYFSVENNSVEFHRLINQNGDTLSVHEIIDHETFNVVGMTEAEKRLIRNHSCFGGNMNVYYYDQANFYAFLDREFPEFLLLGATDETYLLGGDYVRVGDKLFSAGVQMDSVDIKSFHTMEIWRGGDRFSTIGLDNKHIYFNEDIMSETSFERIIAPNDSLRKIYFPNKCVAKPLKNN
jgi:hypothetical protein